MPLAADRTTILLRKRCLQFTRITLVIIKRSPTPLLPVHCGMHLDVFWRKINLLIIRSLNDKGGEGQGPYMGREALCARFCVDEPTRHCQYKSSSSRFVYFRTSLPPDARTRRPARVSTFPFFFFFTQIQPYWFLHKKIKQLILPFRAPRCISMETAN